MEIKNLKELIKSKWFDNFQSGLESRFSAEGMTYNYLYENNDSKNSVVVFLGNDKIKTKLELVENGDLNFCYSENE